MQPNASTHLRIARPSRNLDRARRFWVDGVGLQVLHQVTHDPHTDSHALLMLGWPQAAWHLELVDDPHGYTPPAPTPEDLLVLYLGGPIDKQLLDRLTTAGGTPVTACNPYWDRWGITVADPDGYRLVLSHRSWP